MTRRFLTRARPYSHTCGKTVEQAEKRRTVRQLSSNRVEHRALELLSV
jgi:hypothetical protein